MAFLTRLKSNRLVDHDNTTNRPLETIDIHVEIIVVNMKIFNYVILFRTVSKNEDTQYWVTDVLDLDELDIEDLANKSWKIEECHREIKQYYGMEKCHAR